MSNHPSNTEVEIAGRVRVFCLAVCVLMLAVFCASLIPVSDSYVAVEGEAVAIVMTPIESVSVAAIDGGETAIDSVLRVESAPFQDRVGSDDAASSLASIELIRETDEVDQEQIITDGADLTGSDREVVAEPPEEWRVLLERVASIAPGGGQDVSDLRLAQQMAPYEIAETIAMLLARWERQQTAAMALEEAALAARAGQPYRATERVALAVVLLSQSHTMLAMPATAPEHELFLRVALAIDQSDDLTAHAYEVMEELNRRAAMDASIAAEISQQPSDVVADTFLPEQRLLANARDFMGMDRLDDASRSLEELLRLNPDRRDAQVMLDSIWRPRGELAEALATLYRGAGDGFAEVPAILIDVNQAGRVYATPIRFPQADQRGVLLHERPDGSRFAQVVVPLGSFVAESDAAAVYERLIARCRDAVPPDWAIERLTDRSFRFAPHPDGPSVSLQLALVAYDGPNTDVSGQIVIEVTP